MNQHWVYLKVACVTQTFIKYLLHAVKELSLFHLGGISTDFTKICEDGGVFYSRT